MRQLNPAAHRVDPPGRSLPGLLGRVVRDLDQYTVRDGNAVARVALGCRSGDGHLHDERLLAAILQCCSFSWGQLRIVTLEAQPIHRRTQLYRIFDAATGKHEEGRVSTAMHLAHRFVLTPSTSTQICAQAS